MKCAVLGTGSVGQTLASRLAELGHSVTVGTRDPATTLARGEEAPWSGSDPKVGLATFSDAAAAADLVLNATNGSASLEVLGLAGTKALAGKILIDVSNPLDFSAGFPPTLFVKDTDSLGEQIQRAFPDTKVVKALNTMTASVMAYPSALGGPSTVFVSGDDAGAKRTVSELLHEIGHADVIDLGDISTARGAEMVLPLWLRVMGSLGTTEFNFKIVR